MAELVPTISTQLSTGSLQLLVDVLQKVCKHNFTSALLLLGGAVMSCHYSRIIQLFGSFPIVLAFGPTETGKSTSIQAALSLFGLTKAGFYVEGSNAYFMERSALSCLPYGIDEVTSDSKQYDLVKLIIALSGGAKTANLQRGVFCPLSAPLVATNFALKNDPRHGILEIVRSDNGLQFLSHKFSQFAKRYGFNHVTSSPHYPQSNGQIEQTVQTVKNLLKKSDDPHLAILSYRATPFPWCGLSPFKLSMGRMMRSTIPQTSEQLTPTWPYLSQFRKVNDSFKSKQKKYDSRHRVKKQEDLQNGSDIWVTTDGQRVEGQVSESNVIPRSYVIVTPTGEVSQNQNQLNVVPPISESTQETTEQPNLNEKPKTSEVPRRIQTHSQTQTVIHPPHRLAQCGMNLDCLVSCI